MSYLNLPRLTFAGMFEADVNTVNNDVRNFDCTVFEPRLQTAQVGLPDGRTEYNGWWNPNGSNAFRLLECRVRSATGPNGQALQGEAALSFAVDAQRERTWAKIVDLDPQFQFASGLWGMRIALTHGRQVAMSATLRPTSFRDLYFGRLIDQRTGQSVPGSASASARFTGLLDDIWWSEHSGSSLLLSLLRDSAEANDGKLQLSLMTYGYTKAAKDARNFTFGSVLGTIGSARRGEPQMFAPGRRFAPATPGAAASSSGIGYMTGAVSDDETVLSVDFGNALPLWLADKDVPSENAPITVQDLGPLTVAVLKDVDQVGSGPTGLVMAPAATEGDGLAPDRYEIVGVLEGYDMAWLERTGGIADFAMPAAARALVAGHPLVVLQEAGGGVQTIAIRETTGGVWVRADDFVQRVDSAPTGWVRSDVSLYAMQYGKPWDGAPIDVSVLPVSEGDGGTGDPKEVRPPQTVIPPINTPAEKISLPARIASGPDGWAKLVYAAENPQNVRRYIDGQIYQIGYSIAATGQSGMPSFEFIAVHVRDAYEPPEVPSWASDVAPILVQYGNLYPIMSKGLFQFDDPAVLAEHARLLQLAFTRPAEDPNFMPATRDLSAGKLRTIVKWLSSYLSGGPIDYGAIPMLPVGGPKPVYGPTVVSDAHPSRPTVAAAEETLKVVKHGNDGKTAAVRTFLKNRASKA